MPERFCLQNTKTRLVNQHGIAKTEESVPFPYRLLIGMQNIFPRRKGGHQHNECRLRQMKVRNKPVHDFKTIARIDKNIRPCTSRMENAVLIGIRFNCPAGGCSRADNSSTGFLRAVD